MIPSAIYPTDEPGEEPLPALQGRSAGNFAARTLNVPRAASDLGEREIAKRGS
jgi:hypothetical protein